MRKEVHIKRRQPKGRMRKCRLFISCQKECKWLEQMTLAAMEVN